MKAYVFPGQGSQYSGMGKDLYDESARARELFEEADQILGFELSKTMFEGSDEELKQTRITQPAIFLHSVITAELMGDNFRPDMVAGHSLGEFSALVANKTLSFKDGLTLVYKRAMAMQKACEHTPSTMAAILGLENNIVESACDAVDGIVVAANYNSPGQVVISGSIEAVNEAVEKLNEAGARRTLILPVGGAFHSPLMESARTELEEAINSTHFSQAICPVYQNVTANAVSDPETIKQNLVSQLTSPVKWTQTMQQMIADGMSELIEVGPGKVLQGLVKKVDRKFPVSQGEWK